MVSCLFFLRVLKSLEVSEPGYLLVGTPASPLHLRVVNLFHRCKPMGGARALLLESQPIFPISGGFPYLDSVVGHCLLLYCKIRAWALQAMESQN